MSVIYVLQKEVPGLGQLTKVGMTVRSGEDRANEYGGGGWDVVAEIGVAVEDVAELKSLEGRIHERLSHFRSDAAVGFGLNEVFSCTPEQAVAAAHAEISAKATDEDQVQRMRKRTNRTIERRIVQAHAAELARLHMGKFEKEDFVARLEAGDVPFSATERETAEYRIHQRALEALDRIGAEATTFRAMVKVDLAAIGARWDEHRRHEREREERQVEARRQARNLEAAKVAAEKTLTERAVAENERLRRIEVETGWARDHQRRLGEMSKSASRSQRVFWVAAVAAPFFQRLVSYLPFKVTPTSFFPA